MWIGRRFIGSTGRKLANKSKMEAWASGIYPLSMKPFLLNKVGDSSRNLSPL
jgi:hypothetical protein